MVAIFARALSGTGKRPPTRAHRLPRLSRQASSKLVQKLRASTRTTDDAGADEVGYSLMSLNHELTDPKVSSMRGRASQRHFSSSGANKKSGASGRKPGGASGRKKCKLPALEGADPRPARSPLVVSAPLPATMMPATTGTAAAGLPEAEALAEAEARPEAAAAAMAEAETESLPTEAEALQAEAEARAAAVEAKRSAFWAAQEQRLCWSVPLARNISVMPWLGAHESGLDAAIAKAHSLGRTPLLIDCEGRAAAYLARRQAVLLDARQMVADERLGVRSHALVMKEARKALVQAMKAGRPLHVSLASGTADFVTHFSGADTLPLAIFDRRVVEALADFTGDGADLWQHTLHPFAQALRPNDLELDGRFSVREGFEVVASTQLDEDAFASRLALSIPLPKMQPIVPTPW